MGLLGSFGIRGEFLMILFIDEHWFIARYVLRHAELDLCHKTLAMLSVAITPKS